MREFSSYGPINKKLHYYVPRKDLFSKAYKYLIGEEADEGGHYITVWAPRQTGKSSLLRDIYWEILQDKNYLTSYISIQNLQDIDNSLDCFNAIISYMNRQLDLQLPQIRTTKEFQNVFSDEYLSKPLILIMDEFDSLQENVIYDMVGVFRNIFHMRAVDPAPSYQKQYLLHGLALIGIRSVVGVENISGSPFNINRSFNVHNLTEEEVHQMYHWYEEESGQTIAQDVIEKIYYVTQGQPGLVSWFGELLTKDYNNEPDRPLTMEDWNKVYGKALHVLPNNNILNIISKATSEKYRSTVLNLFRIDKKEKFEIGDSNINYLYMHGVISYEEVDEVPYITFPSPFVQEKLFNHFSRKLGQIHGDLLVEPFMDLASIVSDKEIHIEKMLELYQNYYNANKEWLTEYATRMMDMRIMEVVYHFQLYSWLESFLHCFGAVVIPKFPTGNGKMDLLIRYKDRLYGLELKSFSQLYLLDKNIDQASRYGQCLGLEEITLIVFLDNPLPDTLKEKYNKPYLFPESAVVNVFSIEPKFSWI